MIKLPEHKASLSIEHNPHKDFYISAKEYLEDDMKAYDADDYVSEEDKRICINTNDFWVIRWYPHTPVGFNIVIASTLEKALEKANA